MTGGCIFLHGNCTIKYHPGFLSRHTNEMIEKLHSAGLGFYVRDAEIQQKFGGFTIMYCSQAQ